MMFALVWRLLVKGKKGSASKIVSEPGDKETSAKRRETDKELCLRQAAEAVGNGHTDPKHLREILIWTTDSDTYPVVMEYLSQHFDDRNLLSDLLDIASEGEDSGDAPWAAANVIAEFPAELLEAHETALRCLSQENWEYLSDPAKLALSKIEGMRRSSD